MSSTMVGNGYQQNYNTYNGQPPPDQGQNVEGYYDPHPSSRPPANEYYGSSTSQPQSVQTSPRRGVYYRLASPEVGLPLGRYEEQRKSLDEQRQRDYFAMMSQKEQKEQQKRQEEKLKKQAHTQVLQKHQAQQKLYNYDEVQRKLREERRKDYDEFVKMKEEQAKIKEPATPPGGLDVGQYELYRKRLKEDLVNDYKSSLLQKEQKPSPRRMPTPPNGLDIVTQDERTRQAREKQRLYGQELQKQSQQQMLQKIQNNIAVIDRTGQQAAIPNQYNQVPPQQHSMPPPQQHASPPSRNVAPNPPPQSSSPPPRAPQHAQMLPPQQHQSQMRTPQIHHNQMQNFQREHHQATPAGSQSPPPRQRNHPTPHVADQGHYAEFNGKQQSPVDSRDGHRPPPHPRRYTTPDRLDWARGPPRQNGTPTGRSSHRENPPDIYLESYRRNPIKDLRQQERNREYKHFLSEEEMKAQQKKEKLETLRRQPAVQPKYDNYSSSDNHQRYQKNLNNERRDQYQSFLSQKKKGEVHRRQGDPSMDEKNMFSDMGKSQEAQRQRVREDAKQNYNNYIDHAFPEGLERGQPSFATRIPLPDSWYTAQPPTHRRSPPRDYRPEQERSSDLYAGRLEQARANEAMYRRHDHEMNGQRPPPPRQEAPYALH